MLWNILIVVAIIAVAAVIIITIKRRNEKLARIYHAAENILKNEYIDYSLHNPMLMENITPPQGRRTMLHISVVGSKPVKEFVFDPSKTVGIGRSTKENSIVLNEAIVSLEHCTISALSNNIVLKDLGSANGTSVKRGRQLYPVDSGQGVKLESGDIIVIGSTQLKIQLFEYDMTWM